MSFNPNVPDRTTNPANNNQRNAIIIVVVLVVIVGIILLLNRPDNTANNTTTEDRPAGANQADDNTFAAEGITLGDFVSGTALDRDSCVINTTTNFDGAELIYVGLLNSTIPANTPVFVRLYQNGTAIEDTDEVSSPEDFQGCLWFQFSATDSAEVLQNGSYEAEIFVNTRPADTISFSVN